MITEGYFVKYDGVYWAVKGCFHPQGYVVGIPRLYKGEKIKRYNDAMNIVRRDFPHLLRYVEEIGAEVPLIPLKGSEVLDPFDLKKVTDPKVKYFISLFRHVGITGSLLYFKGKNFNDIDLLSFDIGNYEILRELRKAGITKSLSSFNQGEVEILNSHDFNLLKRERVLEGIFHDIPYTFKIVECEDFGKVKRVEKFEGKVTIDKTLKPYSLPVKYLTDTGHVLTSFRTRFTELKEGLELYVDGFLLERDKFSDIDLDIARKVEIL
ncbi:hypothetical protein [Sulfolobus acidocaldarius]|uniref:Conserved protein n=4 Tax=Sulfolobus acidocaldarius TaxID=2285 RepID=Q4JC40_SULAC|nr:hypothetical protein [Sulfolobus acidocaldarius]AAY79639.1 conserved protein [Sulfolobus acidocaldarius DSM 639]AGE70193.1 hypothetical protein SacN8_01060 [Sulfolobus acidocaldarius N8]AGE72468.1 hypothetical protein SacRon12I_01060 [Sulfolobus acidocaldarius Ron12/I]ALU29397.1 hypothetical protein ATY89_05185 [Sulfolobus acidocaldarius]ALU32125.1 hypothetical protein ATZ20_08205 [Sulfolobus acidocaldarius]